MLSESPRSLIQTFQPPLLLLKIKNDIPHSHPQLKPSDHPGATSPLCSRTDSCPTLVHFKSPKKLLEFLEVLTLTQHPVWACTCLHHTHFLPTSICIKLNFLQSQEPGTHPTAQRTPWPAWPHTGQGHPTSSLRCGRAESKGGSQDEQA